MSDYAGICVNRIITTLVNRTMSGLEPRIYLSFLDVLAPVFGQEGTTVAIFYRGQPEINLQHLDQSVQII